MSESILTIEIGSDLFDRLMAENPGVHHAYFHRPWYYAFPLDTPVELEGVAYRLAVLTDMTL